MKIGVIGGGVVGNATAEAWRGHCDEVRVYDRDLSRCAFYCGALPMSRDWAIDTDHQDLTHQSDVVFICLPETAVETYIDAIPGQYRNANYVLRSTVPVGTTRRLAERYGLPNLVHSPEFLTERTAAEDAKNPRLNVVGYAVQGDVTQARYKTEPMLEVLYAHRFPNVPTRVMTSDASELMKLATNAFFADKVSFWNEVESYCRATGIDYETVRAACVAEGRVGDLHTHVPGPDGRRGWGGKCLGKDTRQLVRCLTDAGSVSPVMTAVLSRNRELDRPEGE